MRTFVFAIGGSGARVLRSLSMLLTAGCKNSSVQNPIIPLIIDYDITNGDTQRVNNEILPLYRSIHKDAYSGNETDREHFFCTPIQALSDVCADGLATKLGLSTKFDLHLDATKVTNRTFAAHIGFSTLNDTNGTLETSRLLSSLYDSSPEKTPLNEDNPKAELNMNLHKGFRGCPNLGCIITKQLEESPELKLVVSTLIRPTDRIVIIGSVFGGTGASGIPMLLDFFDRNPNAKDAKKAVIAVLPYFSVNPDVNSATDSNTFIAKTKAAIDAYSTTVNQQADCIYYVGDKTQKVYANHDGNAQQKNNAHYVELVGAMCVMDFISQASEGAFECGVENWDDSKLDYNTFFTGETITPYIHPLQRFKLFSAFCKNYLFTGKSSKNDNWLNGINGKSDAIGDSSCNIFRSNLQTFMNYFDTWIDEMADAQSHRPLVLFKKNSTEYRYLLEYKVLEKSNIIRRRSSLIDDDNFTEFLTDSFNRLCEEYPNRPKYLFLRNAKDTMDKIDDIIK